MKTGRRTLGGGWIVLFLLLVAAGARAQVFYSVTTPGGDVNWLLGTIHAEDARVLEFPPVLEQALRQADRLALELVPDESMLQALAREMRLPPGEVLADRIGPRLYRRVARALADYGMDRKTIRRLQPWAAAMTLSQPPLETGMFMDLALSIAASRSGAELIALETLDEQLAFFTGLGEDAHVRLLEAAVEEPDSRSARLEVLIEAWLAGDLERLRRLAERELAGLDAETRARFRTSGIVERNVRMARRAQPLLEHGNTLVAVGALHLPGADGLIALLREQGNRVEVIY
ncbi:MAG: TraB/GumN family protein [Wenzhouxiangellaceae bacterium]|nr:TraB/GumN family protein [Wenzhouxiangellaceae bacterium]